MVSGQPSLRKLIKSIIKDSTSIHTEYKDINVAILKATNHLQILPKEKHVGISDSRPRADVGYCIQSLKRRLKKTRSWVVALKTLIVIHRAMREVDNSFLEEVCFHSQQGHKAHFSNLRHFKDDSSPSACDCSSWIRTYALYIEECLQCFRTMNYDFYTDHKRMKKLDIPALLDQLPFLQQLLLRLLCCQPIGAARYNYLIQYALSIVAEESVRLYVAITDGVLILVDKFFEMQHRDAVPALEIYRRAVKQAQRLFDFFEMCRSLEFGQKHKYVRIEQPPVSFLLAMENYIKVAPLTLALPSTSKDDDCVTSKVIAIPNPKKASSEQGSHSSDDCEKGDKVAPLLIPDLLSWDEPSQEVDGSSHNTMNSQVSSEATSWGLASPDAAPFALCQGGILDRSVLDSLYEKAITKPSQNGDSHTPNASNPFEADDFVDDQNMFYYQQPAASVQQQQGNEGQSMVVYDYMQIAGITQQQPEFAAQNYQQRCLQVAGIHQQQQELSSPHVDFSKLTVPVQQKQEPVAGNPFIEQGSFLL